jgi:hypothetical protein
MSKLKKLRLGAFSFLCLEGAIGGRSGLLLIQNPSFFYDAKMDELIGILFFGGMLFGLMLLQNASFV